MKKLLSILLVAVMLLTMVPFTVSAAGEISATNKVEADSTWYDASKTTLEVYDAADLLAFANMIMSHNFAGKTIKIMADIDFNPGYDGRVPTEEEAANLNLWPDVYDKGFWGSIDGQGHTISGLYKAAKNLNFGFFGCNSGNFNNSNVVISDLAITNSLITIDIDGGDASTLKASTKSYAIGGFFGSVWSKANTNNKTTGSVTFRNVYNDIDIRFNHPFRANDSKTVGGFVGMTRVVPLTFDNCVYAGSIELSSIWAVGGYVGLATNDANKNNHIDETGITFKNSAFLGRVASTGHNASNGAQMHSIGGFIGRAELNASKGYVFEQCVAGGSIHAGNRKAAFIASNNASNGVPTCKVSFANCAYTAGCIMPWEHGATVDTVSLATASTLATLATTTPAFANLGNWSMFGNSPIPAGLANAMKNSAAFNKITLMIPDTDWYYKDVNAQTFTISTPAELLGFGVIISTTAENFSGKTILLADDIDMNPGFDADTNQNPAVQWADTARSDNNVSASFGGTFDGQGHTISGLYLRATYNYTGFFGNLTSECTSGIAVKNLAVVNSKLYACDTYTGGLFGTIGAGKSAEFDNLYIDINVEERGAHKFDSKKASEGYTPMVVERIGGVVGCVDTTGKVSFNNVVVAGDVKVNDRVMSGGIVGVALNAKNTLSFTDVAYLGTVSGHTEIGGMVGRIYAGNYIFTNCVVTGANDNAFFGVWPKALGTVPAPATLKFENCYYTAATNAYPTYDEVKPTGTPAKVAAENLQGAKGVALILDKGMSNWKATAEGILPAGALGVLNGTYNNTLKGVKLVGYQETVAANGKRTVRLVGVVDGLAYENVGFNVTGIDGVTVEASTVAYTRLSDKVGGADVTAKEFGAAYLFVVDLKDVSAAELKLNVTAYYTVTGQAPVTCGDAVALTVAAQA